MTVAVLAPVFFCLRGVWDFGEWYIYSKYGLSVGSSPLLPGQSVITVGEYRVGTQLVPSGTPGVVEMDDAGDLDDCYPEREIVIKILSGKKQGDRVVIPRSLLRTRNR